MNAWKHLEGMVLWRTFPWPCCSDSPLSTLYGKVYMLLLQSYQQDCSTQMMTIIIIVGSGNIIALDVLRAQSSFPILLNDIKLACGVNKVFDSFVANLESKVERAANMSGTDAQRSARFLADHLALALQGSIMIRYGDAKVSEQTTSNIIHVNLSFFLNILCVHAFLFFNCDCEGRICFYFLSLGQRQGQFWR